jgi:hypothetical protein
MNDLFQAKVRCLQSNIDRYCRLLATELTVVEREFIHRRIAQERTDLEMLLQSKRTGGLRAPAAHVAVEPNRHALANTATFDRAAESAHVL